jgi:hypothetical protein
MTTVCRTLLLSCGCLLFVAVVSAGQQSAVSRRKALASRQQTIPRNENAAVAKIRTAAEQGDAEAQFSVATFYQVMLRP